MAKRDKKPAPIDPPKDLGAALFLELMMQMLAFFILLTSMAVIVEEKRLAAIGSLAGTFSPLPKGANLSEGDGPSMPAKEVVDGSRAPKRTAKELTELAKDLGMDGALTALPLDQDTVRIRFPEQLAFKSGHVDLTPEMYVLMDEFGRIFRRPEVVEIKIVGHTDDTPIRSSVYASNWELSAARAMSVFHGLAERGVPNGRMIVMGMGDKHPVPGHPELSRRVEIELKFRPVTANPENQVSGGLGMEHRSAVAPPQKGF